MPALARLFEEIVDEQQIVELGRQDGAAHRDDLLRHQGTASISA